MAEYRKIDSMEEAKKRHNKTCLRKKLIMAIQSIRDKETREKIAKAVADVLVDLNKEVLCKCRKCKAMER
jgi:hypothetical protein